ncbi:hypothetical protein HDU87_006469 [Geranomyces variabilis]|uniref:Uncharacterized protein n=1 Tax=Geranomyces variabilis TaxID=109894 RepID=A0AAD5TF94_9FUNG|nr:hypothetical protein HDU87_006469 [Geranomyces variabilis]
MADDPTDFPSCIVALTAANQTLVDSQYALLLQAWDYGFKSDGVLSILAMLLHTLFVVLLVDRIVLLKHRPTKIAFWVSIASQNIYNLFNIFSDVVDWWDDTDLGYKVYYYIRAAVLPINQWAIIYLLYLRVRDSLLRVSPKWRMAALALTHLVLPLEWLKQYYAVVWNEVNDDAGYPYPTELMVTTTAYRILLDVSFSLYTLWIIHGASSGDKAGQQGRRSKMSEDTAFIVGYALRAILFLALDILFVAVTIMDMSFSDISFRAMTIWACAQALSPIKPYLVVTDMARIRALSAEPAASLVDSSHGGARTAVGGAGQSVMNMVKATKTVNTDDAA